MICIELSLLWKDLGKWGVIFLGKWGVIFLRKGFFKFTLSSLENVRRVREFGAWHLFPSLLKLFPWSKYFTHNIQKRNTAQVWVWFHGLAQEYWRLKILFAIASSIWTPICYDIAPIKPIIDRTFGHYVRLLVDMDVSSEFC